LTFAFLNVNGLQCAPCHHVHCCQTTQISKWQLQLRSAASLAHEVTSTQLPGAVSVGADTHRVEPGAASIAAYLQQTMPSVYSCPWDSHVNAYTVLINSSTYDRTPTKWATYFQPHWSVYRRTGDKFRHTLRKYSHVTCNMGSHSVTCHRTQMNAPHLPQPVT